MANQSIVICTNVFKNKEEAVFRSVFTEKWLELINQLEKNNGQLKYGKY